MTCIAESDRSKILTLIERVLQVRLTLWELFEEWPKDEHGNRIAAQLFGEIESAIAHMPGEGYPQQISITKWNQSREKLELELYRILLARNASLEELDVVMAKLRRNWFSKAQTVQALMQEIQIN